MKRPSISASTFLVNATLAVALPAIIFATYLIAYVGELERTRAERQAIDIARQAQQSVDGELTRYLAALDGLAAATSLARWDLAEFHEEARRLVAGGDQIIVLRSLGAEQFVNTELDYGRDLPPPVPIPDEERKTLLAGRPLIAGVYLSPTRGEPRIAVAKPVRRAGVTYALALTAPTTQVRDALLRTAPPAWIIGVGDKAGRYVTRSARHEAVSGTPTDPTYLAKIVDDVGSFQNPNLDGVLSLAGYVRSELSGWVYAANIPYSEITRPVRRSIAGLAGAGLLTLAACLLIAYILSRRFASAAAALSAQALALGAGSPVLARSTGLTEFEVVSRALTKAGNAIEERTRERERFREREALLGSVLDAADLHVGIVKMSDGAARLVVGSREAGEFFSRFENGSGNLLRIPALATWSSLLVAASEAPHPVGSEYTVRVGSELRHFMGTFVRLPAPGMSMRIAFIASDITAKHAAEEMALARTHELETVLATVPAAVWFTYDRNARTTIRNKFAAQVLRGARVEIHSPEKPDPSEGSVHFFRMGEPIAECDMPLRAAMRGDDVAELELEFRFWDRTVRTVLMSATALRNAAGNVVGAVAVALDITERKRAEDQRRLLINELNHRVKNTLASVQSLVAQSLRGASSPSSASKVVTERLVALAKAHDLLTRESWEGADLQEVVQATIAAYPDAARFQVHGPRVWLKPSVSLAFSMAIHELTTNAIKYGALSGTDGEVVIIWDLEDNGATVSFQWRERGGPEVGAPTRRGFGSRLIERSFASEDGGHAEMKFEREGLVCEITAPAERRTLAPIPCLLSE